MLERSGRTALPADVELDRLAADQGDVFNEQAQNPLAFARRRARIVPYSWQIRDQRMNAVPRLLIEPRPLVFHCARILLLGLGEFGEPLVPPALQAVCHQPVFWPDEHELTLRQLRLLAGALDLGAVKAMDLSPARSQLLEHFEGNLQ